MTWEILDKINLIIGIISFFISIITLLLSINIRAKVSQRLEKVDFQEQIVEYIGQLQSIFDFLGKDSSNADKIDIESIKRVTNDAVTEITTRYTFLPKELIKDLNNLLSTDFDKINKDNSEYYDFRNEIKRLIILLEKEKTHGT